MSTPFLKDLVQSATSQVGMFSSNLANKAKQVIIKVEGISYTLSPKLTADFRAKRVKLDELGEYVVRTIALDDGTIMNSLGYPGEDVNVVVNFKNSTATPKKITTVDELMAIVAF
jgi:hypothetical protein